jgi:hypothetical protein
MPTENRRVAAYLPKELDDRFKAFIAERNLKGESQALVVILSEFLGVSQQVAQQVDYSEFVKFNEFQKILDKVSRDDSNSELLNSLAEKIKCLEERLETLEVNVLPLPVSSPMPYPYGESTKQMDLLTAIDSTLDDSLSSPNSELLDIKPLRPLNGHELGLRFRLDKGAPSKERRRMPPERFLQWTIEKDPDDIAWEYDELSKLYIPKIEDFSSAMSPNQINPLPVGSERSEEG